MIWHVISFFLFFVVLVLPWPEHAAIWEYMCLFGTGFMVGMSGSRAGTRFAWDLVIAGCLVGLAAAARFLLGW